MDYLQLQNFILDIDGIQAHGIGAADITKLKANGFYTVAVSASTLTTLPPSIFQAHAIPNLTIHPVRPRRHPQDPLENKRFQRGQSRKGQRSNSKMSPHSLRFHHSNGTPPPTQESRPYLNRQQAI